MKQSTFKKVVSATGSQGTVSAEVVATMNYTSKTVNGTNPSTHDDYSKDIPVHKIEVFVNGSLWAKELELTSELMLYVESERQISLAEEHCKKIANMEPVKTFGQKMQELFS